MLAVRVVSRLSEGERMGRRERGLQDQLFLKLPTCAHPMAD